MEKMVKWDCVNWTRDSLDGANLSFEKDREYRFWWPQRSYRCSFCKKEFKSAQALGGHMNVHRRDRARMKLSSPSWDPLGLKHEPKPCLNPNPNPPNPSFPSAKSLACSYVERPSLLSTSSSPKVQKVLASNKHPRQDRATLKVDEVACLGRRKDDMVLKGKEYVGLDLSLGLIQGPKVEDLDLELRLGCS